MNCLTNIEGADIGLLAYQTVGAIFYANMQQTPAGYPDKNEDGAVIFEFKKDFDDRVILSVW